MSTPQAPESQDLSALRDADARFGHVRAPSWTFEVLGAPARLEALAVLEALEALQYLWPAPLIDSNTLLPSSKSSCTTVSSTCSRFLAGSNVRALKRQIPCHQVKLIAVARPCLFL